MPPVYKIKSSHKNPGDLQTIVGNINIVIQNNVIKLETHNVIKNIVLNTNIRNDEKLKKP